MLKVADLSSKLEKAEEELSILRGDQNLVDTDQIVVLKTSDELKKMVRSQEIQLLRVSDDGEVYSYGTIGNPSHVLSVWYDDHGQEYKIVDHPHLLSKPSFDRLKVFFKPKE